jgi:hypothetical protein
VKPLKALEMRIGEGTSNGAVNATTRALFPLAPVSPRMVPPCPIVPASYSNRPR